MKESILKQIKDNGFVSNSDLSNCEVLEKELNAAKGKFYLAKKEMKVAKYKFNLALEGVVTKIETKKKEVKNTQDSLYVDSPSELNMETIKSSYNKGKGGLELRKNNIKKQIEENNPKGTENWGVFKQKLNHNLEDIGAALKGFVTKSSDRKQ